MASAPKELDGQRLRARCEKCRRVLDDIVLNVDYFGDAHVERSEPKLEEGPVVGVNSRAYIGRTNEHGIYTRPGIGLPIEVVGWNNVLEWRCRCPRGRIQRNKAS